MSTMTKLDKMGNTAINRIVAFCISMELPLKLVEMEIDNECKYTRWLLTAIEADARTLRNSAGYAAAGYAPADVDSYIDAYREQLWDAYYTAMVGKEAPPYDPDKMYYPF